MLVVILCTVRQSFPCQLLFQCWASFDTPVMTGLGEGVRQKILIRQVFNRCVIVWVGQGGLSCIPHLPYLGEDLGGCSQKDFLPWQKILGKDGETPVSSTLTPLPSPLDTTFPQST